MDASAPSAPAAASGARDPAAPKAEKASGEGKKNRPPRSRGRAKSGGAKSGGDRDGTKSGGDSGSRRRIAGEDGGASASAQPPKAKEGRDGASSREKKPQKQQKQQAVYKKKERSAATAADPQPAREGKQATEDSAIHTLLEQAPPANSVAPPPAAPTTLAPERNHQSEQKNPKADPNAESEQDTATAKPSNRKEKAAIRKKRPADTNGASSSSSGKQQMPLEDLPTPPHFAEAAWFTASGGDLRFAQWLFGRSQGTADVTTVQDAVVLARVHKLYCLEKRVQHELQNRSNQTVASPEDEQDAENGDEESADQLEDDGNTADGGDSGALWTAAAIVEDVSSVLRVSRFELWKRDKLQQRAASKDDEPKEKRRSLERSLVKELVENTTELLLNRAAFEDIAVLESWLAFLNQDPKELGSGFEIDEKKDDDECAATPEPSEGAEDKSEAPSNENETTDDSIKLSTSKREQKRQQKLRRSGKNPEAAACEQLRSCIAFLGECHRVAEEAQELASDSKDSGLQQQQPPVKAPVADVIANELNRIYLKQRINEFDEARRLRLTQDLQQLFRSRMDKWRRCKVILFGSSLSLYGSISSDLDMCLLMNPSETSSRLNDQDEKKRVVGSRELRLMLNGSTSANSGSGESGAMDMVALQELLLQVKKSIEKITLLYHELNKASASHSQLKQLQQLRFFRAHFKLLQEAIGERVAALSSGDGDGDGGQTAAAVAKAAAARVKEIMARSRRQSDDLFRVKAILERFNCQIRMVISGARIPIIRFQHTPTKLDCDMCFENVLATRNTFLLRSYAAFDERARVLGMAIKHWAKQRAINDASMGFLSSYSFVLLTVYFLQVAAQVLPNLQDPELLAAANVAPEYYNGVNIAFCEDNAAAQRFHHQQQKSKSEDKAADELSTHSHSTLLVWFFEFYATKFDFARRVIAVRAPGVPAVEKRVQWGAQKARSWRMSIQDPLETGRDLGCVLQFKGQEKILREFKRAHELLKGGNSFADVTESEPEAAGDVAAHKKKAAKESKKSESRAYSLTLWRHDSGNLGKPEIERLLRSIDPSIRVGKIESAKAADSKLKKWCVELILPRGASSNGECPAVLKLKSRVDFVSPVQAPGGGADSVEVTTCVMWLHHHALFAHAPCFKCCSPEHPVHECSASINGADTTPNSAHVLRVAAKEARSSKATREQKKKASHPRNGAVNKENLLGSSAKADHDGEASQAAEAFAAAKVAKPSKRKSDKSIIAAVEVAAEEAT